MPEPLGTMRRFESKMVLITGAASGIGAAAATRFAAEGASLALCDLRADALSTFAETLQLDTARLFTRPVDVSDDTALCRFVDDAASHFGRLDVLVNNAGIGAFGHIDEITPATWRQVMSVNLDAVFFACRTALPHLRASRGCIVNTASISGLFADPGLVAYNTAKSALVNLTRNMAVDHATDGIRVNCICPGGVATPMVRSHMKDAQLMADYATLVPMARLGSAEEMAAGITFLASRDASYITGTALVLDGGVTAMTGQPNFDVRYRERGWDQAIFERQANS